MTRATFEEGNERLLKLANQLEAIPESESVLIPDAMPGHKYQIRGYNQQRIIHPCGSPACAWGHYMLLNPEAHKRAVANQECGGWLRTFNVYEPDGSVYPLEIRSIEAAQDEFCLSQEECVALFEANGCGEAKTGAEAAAYIRRFVVERQARQAAIAAVVAAHAPTADNKQQDDWI